MTEMAYEETGTGEPIVFLHGISANRHHWDPVVELLADRHRCINVDLLGHGDSPRAASHDLLAQVTAVTELIADLGLDAPVVAGHSFGGFIATFTATAIPLRAVVNVDQPFDLVQFRTRLDPFDDDLRRGDFADTWTRFVNTEEPEAVPADRQELLWSNIRPDREVILDVWGAVLDTPPEALVDQVAATLPAVTAPYLGLFGTALSDEERRLQALVPNGEVEVWEGHGHFLHLVDPERAADRIAAHAAAATG
jgi:pimeloyl-ACP methyl ester carboxylesterase